MSVIQKNRKVKKWTVETVLLFFLVTQIITGVFLYARPAQAQWVVNDPITGAQTTIKNIKDFFKILVVNAGTMALINAATSFTKKIAYDLAVNIASAGKGQTPLFSTKGWGDELKSAGLDAAGEFIGDFGKMVGVDFCAPPNPRVALSIQLNLANGMSSALPPPTCTWSQITSNWDSFISEVKTDDFLRQAASQFKIGYGAATDLDLAIAGKIGVFDAEQKAQDTAVLSRQEGQGFKAVTDFISGQTKTPAQAVKQASEIATKTPLDAEQMKWSISGQALSAGATAVLGTVASTFIGTLLSKTMARIFSKGMYSLADFFPSGGTSNTTSEATPQLGRRAAELAFADLLTPDIKGSTTAYDPLIDFTICPDKNKSLLNCVIDDSFAAAVRSAGSGTPLTVKEAIDQGYVHGDWFLIPPTNALNFDQSCFEQAYCYSNLVKLRKAMVIPIGWELAAEESPGSWKLSDVVNGFNDCNSSGTSDIEHPYCHLIDPSWILKIPPTRCQATVYGPLLQTSEAGLRQETCVDMPTCIAEDEKGNCQGGWGYCTKEKNIWRFDADACPAYYDTCQTMTKRDGQAVSYLSNTVDYGPPCNADDVGCRWYSTTQAKVGDTWQWQSTLTSTPTRQSDRIFFNKNVAQCDEPGCNEFLRTTAATKLNYVDNSSFEKFTGTVDDGAGDTFAGWTIGSATPNNQPEAVTGGTYFGQTALKIPSGGSNILKYANAGQPVGGKTFTLSFYAKNASDTAICAPGSLAVALGSIDSERPEPINLYWTGTTATLPGASVDLTNWQQLKLSYTAPSSGGHESDTVLAFRFYQGANCLIDAVQLEEGGSTPYHEGWSNAGAALYFKTAPDYYSCYDYNTDGSLNKTNDADQCTNFAKACEEKDVGCEQYTPTNGDPWVPGVANYPDDYCPAECVGYQTFKQVATDFEQDKFPVYFIPSTGRTCSAADVGCDQFTSLETEAVANFNSVRRCEKPAADSATYYTWEGSDTTGYQLKTWILKVGSVTSPDSDPDAGALAPPCTALSVDGVSCDTTSTVGLCTKADTLTNPDCREFYDGAGKKHYRLYSKTIVVTDDCHPYRKTISSQSDCVASSGLWDSAKNECSYNIYLPESRSCSDAAVGCRAYRGNAGANTAVILNDNFDDAAAGAANPDSWSAGTASSESLVAGGKSLSLAVGATTTKDVSASIRKGGIYTLSFWAKGNSRLDIKFTDASGTKVFSSDTVNPTNLSFDWRYFSLGPVYVDWNASGESLQITASGGTAAAYIDNINLREIQSYIYMVKNSWQTPTSCDSSFAVDSTITDSVSCATAGGTWAADRNECVLAAALPQAQLGCQSYTDRANQIHYLKTFSRLCSPDVAGCAKLIKTWNNSAVSAETYNTANDSDPSLSAEEKYSDNVTIPADSAVFIVVDDKYKCAAQNKGCAEFGSPTLDASGNVKLDDSGKPIYDTVDLLADPALYDSSTGRILCQVQYQSCEEYTTSQGGKLYFKDPGPKTCEWKERVSVGGELKTGWFKKGTSDPCDTDFFVNDLYGIWRNADIHCTLPVICQTDEGCLCAVDTTAGATGTLHSSCTVQKGQRSCPYSGWVGECAPKYSMCTKFIDPTDTSKDPSGQPYYYINNDKISTGNCNGMASQKDGCVLVNDTSNPQLIYNANATYANSDKKAGDQGGLVAPIDCSKTPRDPSCKRCLNIDIRSVCLGKDSAGFCTHSQDYTNYHYGNQCQKDSDCSGDYAESTPAISGGGEGCKTVIDPPSNIFEKIIFDSEPSSVNDSNLLVQVRRDRVCSEWLTCLSASSTFDSNTGKFVTLCDKVGACDEFSKAGDETTCADWVERPAELLSKEVYTSRDVTFKGQEYSGYSIPNEYPAEDLEQVNVAGTGKPIDNRLAFIPPDCYDASGAVRPCDLTREPAGTCDADNGLSCGLGKCWNKRCALNFKADKSGAPVAMSPQTGENLSCRGYPESTSPFPSQLGKWSAPQRYFTMDGSDDLIKSVSLLIGKQTGYLQANICEKGQYDLGVENCDCSYRKVQYGQVTKYYSSTEVSKVYDAVCQGGKYDGFPCVMDSLVADADKNGFGCGSSAGQNAGTCTRKTRDDSVIGWQGYCLENDQSTTVNNDPRKTACLTWLPIDIIAGTPDIYNQYSDAGFRPADTYFCARADVYKDVSTHKLGALRTDGTRDDAYYCAEIPYGFGLGEEGECQGSDDLHGTEIGICASNASECDPNKDWTVMAPCGNGGRCTYGVNDCPYKCVPKNSVHNSDTLKGRACEVNQLGSNLHDHGTISGRDVVLVSNYGDATQLDDCVQRGVLTGTDSRPASISYLGCANLTKVSDIHTGSKAWTDRVAWLGKSCATNADCPENYVCLGSQCSYQISADNPSTSSYLRYTNQTKGGISESPLFGQSISPVVGGAPVKVMGCSATGGYSLTLPQSLLSGGGDWECERGSTPWSPAESRAYMDFQATRDGTRCSSDSDCQSVNNCPDHFSDIDWSAYMTIDNDPYKQFLSNVCCFKRCTADSDCGTAGTCANMGGVRHCTQAAHLCENAYHNGSSGGRDQLRCNSGEVKLMVCKGGNFCAEGGQCVQDITCDMSLGLCQDPATERVIGGGGSESTDLSLAKQRMAQLFASSYGTQYWASPTADTSGQYKTNPSEIGDNKVTTNNGKAWDITETGLGDVTPTPPEIYAVGPRCVGTECEELHADAFGHVYPMTVNDRTHGDIISTDGKLKVSLKFFFFANPNQMPVKGIFVDMDNDNTPEFNHGDDNLYKNHRGLKPDLSGSYCDNSTFGQSAGACADQYFSMEYTYTCNGPDSRGWQTTGCPAGTVGCCIFTPRVQVKDNWGWCNGNCRGTGAGCYDGRGLLGGTNECEMSTAADRGQAPWTEFVGKVIVVPK